MVILLIIVFITIIRKKLDEKIKYYFILKNISNIIVTENICKILYDFFKEEKYDKTINIKNEEDLRNILKNLNINFISFIYVFFIYIIKKNKLNIVRI